MDVDALLPDDYLKTTYCGGRFSALKMAGAFAARLSRLPRIRDYDVAFVTGEFFPLAPGQIEAALLPVPYVYDFGDAHFLKYSQQRRFRHTPAMVARKFEYFIARAAAVTAGNAYLADYARQWNDNVHILPTVVPMERYVSAPRRDAGCFTIGWIGSPSTASYLDMLRGALERFGAETPTRLIVVGAQCQPIKNVDVRLEPWSEATEIDMINSFDVGVMPLTDDDWARGKCAFKMIQYMACGVPAIVSPVGANLDVAAGGAALLAGNDEEWLSALRCLRDDAAFRQKLGAAGRERIAASYSLENAAPKLASILQAVTQGQQKSRKA
ncbi:MAG: glycosyltransferase family 4 protein [Hyphomicrobiales bacterium]|nr:glycosyltransferase family 4 protein [Hyphomicrobiales bacterium]